MGRGVSSFDVARLAGVSQATVSYVLNDRKGLSLRPETRRRVQEAATQLGYQPNHAARSLAKGRTGTIEVWVPFAYHPVFGQEIEHFMRLAKNTGVRISLTQLCDNTVEILAEGGHLSRSNVDGIILVDERHIIDLVAERYADAPPFVSIGPMYSSKVDHVGVDAFRGAKEAVRHLLDQGCRRVAHATFKWGGQESDPRRRAYVEAITEAALEPEIILLEVGEYADTCDTIRRLFAADDHPDGLFLWNDEAAIGANRALADLGLRVPEDVAIAGFDGIKETLYTVPSLTTVAQPIDEMCLLAWSALLARIENPRAPISAHLLPASLIVRESTNRTGIRKG